MLVHKNNAIFGSVCMKKKKRKKRVVTSRGKHNMDVMTSVTSYQAFFFLGGGGAWPRGKNDINYRYIGRA